jgi:hypothetical protein
MSDTLEQAPKSKEAGRLAKLSRMLRSMSRRFPRTSLLSTSEGFGVRLDDSRYLHIVYSGRWSAEDIGDWFALFAAWLRVDPATLMDSAPPLSGVSIKGLTESD